jgi:hypothetical protein
VAQFPNVSAIDVREVLASIQTIVDNVTLAISIVGAIALVSGVLILAGAVAMTKFQRVYEAAILRTLGASTRVLGAMLALEYGGLGCSPAPSAPAARLRSRGPCRATCSTSRGVPHRASPRSARSRRRSSSASSASPRATTCFAKSRSGR